jgi:hypothetical protein
MGLNLNAGVVAGATVAGAATAVRKPTAKVWLNPGKMITFPGEEEAVFVGLPQGLPLDTMDRVKTNQSSPKMRALNNAKNSIVDAVMAACEGRAPGDVFYVNLTCQVRITNDDAVPVEKIEADAVSAALADLIMA